LCLTVSQIVGSREVMDITKPNPIVRTFAATLVTVAIIGFSALAMHAPAQTRSPVTLKSIQTDRVATLYAGNRRPDCAWFREAVLPTGDSKLAYRRPNCAWFREAVVPTGDSKLMTENLQSVAAKL
jgi:hypothetical protein